MANPASSQVQNLLPVQAYFDVKGNFVTFIGQNKPFYAVPDPYQSGLHITNSTIDSTTIGATTPSTGVFTSGQVNTLPIGSTDIANKQYVDSVAAGLSWKAPVATATLSNITLSGLQTVDGYTTLAGDRVLVKNQTNAANNGIYVAASGAWSRASDADAWNEYVSAITFVQYGTQASSAWYCSAQPGGTLGVTPINWSNFSVAATYTAGTGLTLVGYQFNIANTTVTAGSYGSASSVGTFTVNAQGQLTAAATTPIAIANTQVSGLGTMSTQNATSVAITGGSIDGTAIGATTASTVRGTTITATSQFSGPGTGLTGTASGLSIGGNAATATSATSATTATTATNLAGGANGSLPYQTGSGATSFLAAGTNGQILTLAAGVPAWANAPSSMVYPGAGIPNSTGSAWGTSYTTTGSGSVVALQTSPSFVTPSLGVATGTSLQVTSGLYSTSSSSFTYTDGIVVDYVTGNGRISVGTADGLTFYNGGVANTSLGSVSSAGVWSLPTLNLTNALSVAYGGTGSTSLTANNVLLGNGTSALQVVAPGASGNVLTSNGTTWVSSAATGGLTISDDTTTNATRYPVFSSATSGSISTEYTSSTKYKYNPSTGDLTAPQHIAGNGLMINTNTNTTSYTIASGQNAMSVGPFTTASGTTITVPSGSKWVVL